MQALEHLSRINAYNTATIEQHNGIVPSLMCAMRGASEGPLATLIPVFVDVETYMNKAAGISLDSQTLRQYVESSYLTAMAVAIGEDDPIYISTKKGKLDKDGEDLVEALKVLAQDPAYVFVAHNAAFDMRILRFMLDIPHPINVWCTLEGAMGAWPEFVGGFGLQNLTHTLIQFPADKQKIELDLESEYTDAQLEEYNKRDVVALRELYYRQVSRLPACEQQVALMTHNVRRFHFEVSQERLTSLLTELDAAAAEAERSVENMKWEDVSAIEIEGGEVRADGTIFTDDDIRNIFNRDDPNNPGALRSIRSARLKNAIKMRFGVEPPKTSLKKLEPAWQAKHVQETEVIRQVSRANKMISHSRRSKVLINVNEVDVELGYMRAHTGRFSSPSQGKGLNLHNCPKHDKAVARPVRKTFTMPEDKCLVRADLANVEYRVEGWLTNCKTVFNMFDPTLGGNIFNDPYCLSWESMTRVKINKKDPIRQVAKSAVLGLGFCMSAWGYANVLMRVIGDPNSGVTEATLAKMIQELGWKTEMRHSAYIIEKCGCTPVVAAASWHIHKLFNEAHPEFGTTAEWLVRAVTSISNCGIDLGAVDKARYALDRMYKSESAPDRDKIGLEVDYDDMGALNVRVRCGPWVPTVCWRAPGQRRNKFVDDSKNRLSIMKASGYDKTFTKQLAIENITQAAARNSLCWGLLDLQRKYGVNNVLHIHDEIMIICDRKREAVLEARRQLTDVFGPGSSHPLSWAILVKPEEISVTSSLWEEESDLLPEAKGGFDRWAKIEQGVEGCLLNLP